MTSTSKPSSYDQQLDKFLTEYKKPETVTRYRKLAKLARDKCEKLLDSSNIKGMVRWRVKSHKSLEEKMRDMATDEEFRNLFSENKSIYDHPDMGDLAGVRIGVYLPGDVLKVAEEIKHHFVIKHCFGTVTGGRDATHDKNLDLQNHANGPWTSRDSDRWEHYGYKSWQMVAELKPEDTLLEDATSTKFEIQIGTVVTQAWAEVQHRIIYKTPEDMVSTPTMKRMIDATNGLAITTEIMLRELERSIEIAKKEAEARNAKPFESGQEFSDWFESTYKSKMPEEERKRWVEHEASNEALLNHYKSLEDYPPCRATFKKLIKDKKLLKVESDPQKSYNIATLLINATGSTYGLRRNRHTTTERRTGS